ncbi:DUF7619 domain-containing protein [Rufibacter immobilis]|uniref:DUF7619 domain-containing protein n=1 Tax=Rufibacter immobilis TaxID=1348778 RepID=UPI0035EBF527
MTKFSSVSHVGDRLKSIAVDKDGFIYITGGKSQFSITVSKLDKNFNTVWNFTEGTNGGFWGSKVLVDESGNVYVAGTVSSWSILGLDLTPENSCCKARDFLLKISPQGKFLWINAGLGAYIISAASSIAFDRAGNIVLAGTITGGGKYGAITASSSGNNNLLLVRYSPQGEALMAQTYGVGLNNISGHDLAIDEFDNIYVAGNYSISATFGSITLPIPTTVQGIYSEAFLVKLRADGSVIWAKGGNVGGGDSRVHSLAYKNGRLQLAGKEGDSFLRSKPYVLSYRHDGTFLWKTHLGQVDRGEGTKVLFSEGSTSHVFGTFFNDLTVANHTFSALGYMDGFSTQVYDTTATPYLNRISGTIYDDKNGNCQLDTNEQGLKNVVVMASPGPYYGITDANGFYSIRVDTGTFVVSPILPSAKGLQIVATCPSATLPTQVRIPQQGTTVKNTDFGNQVYASPYLTAHVSSTRRRRCFQNSTTVSYSNTGFASANGAQVTVQLPEYVSLLSASAPYTRDSYGNYVFQVGNLAPNQQGSISLIDSVSCADPDIRGLTVCTKAWITPGNSYASSPGWNQANLTVSGSSLSTGQARFVISNKGIGSMADSLSFRVFQDQELLLSGKYKLSAADSLVLRFSPTGRAVRVEADQPTGHPFKTVAGANVEMKSANTAGLPSIAMNAFPTDDLEPEIAVECLPIIDSYDPNDKQVLPVGLTAEHYTPTGAPLRYTVRFQNTGTDVAYRVVVVDTLSADLDMGTLQVGAVSHPYRMEVTGKGRPVLTFIFDNILLPDSSRDQAGSNGFLQFSLKPKPGLAERHLVENFADIFFDYNEPVRTNTTQNRIYDLPQEVSEEKQLSAQQVIVSPSISGLTPDRGRAGTLITLSGKNFSPVPTQNQVTFNGILAQVVTARVSELKVLAPSGAFSGKVKVVTPDGAASSSSDFTVFQPPTFISISPREAVPSQVITITGTHFSPETLQDTITFGGVAARVLEASEDQLKVEVPQNVFSARIQLKTLGGQVESKELFRVWHPPLVTWFSPAKAKTGTIVLLDGFHFAEEADRNTVLFGNAVAQVIEAAGGKMSVRVPANASSGKIQVRTLGGVAFSTADFTFLPAPEVSSFTPSAGNAGTPVTISGRNFNADNQADTVYFSGQPAKVLRASPTELLVLAPKGVTSGPLSVVGAGGRVIPGEFNVPELTPGEAISIFPNPSKGEITVNWYRANFTVEGLTVIDAVGRTVQERTVGAALGDEAKLTLSHLGPGIYSIRFQTSEGSVTKRIVVL